MRRQFQTILLVISAVILLHNCRPALKPGPISPSSPGSTLPTRDDNLALGNPSGASANDPNNYLLVKSAYVLSNSR